MNKREAIEYLRKNVQILLEKTHQFEKILKKETKEEDWIEYNIALANQIKMQEKVELNLLEPENLDNLLKEFENPIECGFCKKDLNDCPIVLFYNPKKELLSRCLTCFAKHIK